MVWVCQVKRANQELALRRLEKHSTPQKCVKHRQYILMWRDGKGEIM